MRWPSSRSGRSSSRLHADGATAFRLRYAAAVVRFIDTLTLALLALAAFALVMGVFRIGERQDLSALVWLALGGLALRAGTEALAPRRER